MVNFSKEEENIILSNLKVGACPNCGCAEDKRIMPYFSGILIPSEGKFLDSMQGSVDIIKTVMTICPRCGYISLFSKNHLFNKK